MMRQGNSSLQNLFLQFLFVHVSFQPIGLIRRLPFGNGLAVDHFRQFLILCTCLTNHFSIRKQSRHFGHYWRLAKNHRFSSRFLGHLVQPDLVSFRVDQPLGLDIIENFHSHQWTLYKIWFLLQQSLLQRLHLILCLFLLLLLPPAFAADDNIFILPRCRFGRSSLGSNDISNLYSLWQVIGQNVAIREKSTLVLLPHMNFAFFWA